MNFFDVRVNGNKVGDIKGDSVNVVHNSDPSVIINGKDAGNATRYETSEAAIDFALKEPFESSRCNSAA